MRDLIRSPVVAAALILTAALLTYGAMNRYAPGAYGAVVVDRWTGEACMGDRCWKDGRQVAPVMQADPLAPLRSRSEGADDPLAGYSPNGRDAK